MSAVALLITVPGREVLMPAAFGQVTQIVLSPRRLDSDGTAWHASLIFAVILQKLRRDIDCANGR